MHSRVSERKILELHIRASARGNFLNYTLTRQREKMIPEKNHMEFSATLSLGSIFTYTVEKIATVVGIYHFSL